MDLNFEIKDTGAINKANLDITKINVVGGVNSSGKSTASKLLYCFLKSENGKDLDLLLKNEGLNNIDLNNIRFTSDTSFSDVFYIEGISILDLMDSQIMNLDHIKHIKEALGVEKQTTSSNLISKIQSITNADCFSSAGVRQIGVIQLLLENNTLSHDSFLIIDEPESNLHPDWEIRFAEILVLLTKELNITLYLNSYSPILIEALSLYSQYYDLIDKTSFYLTEKQPNNKYDFKKINPKNMGEVYENLTKSYDELDNLKAKILFKE